MRKGSVRLRHRHCVPCISLDLAGHDSKGDTVRRGLIEGAVPINANNSTGEAGLAKKSSQSDIMVVVKFPVVSSVVL